MNWENITLDFPAYISNITDQNLALFLIAGFVVVLIVAIILVVAEICAYCEIYRKAGVIKCWKALIPVYRYYVLCQLCCSVALFVAMLVVGICAFISCIVGLFVTWFLLVFGLLLFVEFLLEIVLIYKVCRAFDHGIGWTIGFIFLEPIFLLMLAFGKSEYIGKS